MWKNVCCLLMLVTAAQTFGQTLKLNIGSLDFPAQDLNLGDCIQIPITFTHMGTEPLILEFFVLTVKVSDPDGLLFRGVEGDYLVANGFTSTPGFGITNPASLLANVLSGTPAPSCPVTFNPATQGGNPIGWTSGMASAVFVQNNAQAMNWKRATVLNDTAPFALGHIEPGESYLAGVLVFELDLVWPASRFEIEATTQLEDPTGNVYVVSTVPGRTLDGLETEEFFDTSEAFSQVNVAVLIRDAQFKAFLLTAYDTSMDGEIVIGEAAAVTDPMTCSDLGIEDLTGIEAFTNLTGLDANSNNLTELPQNLTDLLDLNHLDISNNLLDVCDCPDIVSIWRVIKENGGQLVLDFINCPVGTSLLGWPRDISVLDLTPQCSAR